MNAAQQIIGPLLKENMTTSCQFCCKSWNGRWYWGPFQISK
jgi:hypothetical protein